MLPSAAEMPPCAATVCERVGNTLVRQAVCSPFAARPNVARNPAPPAPTTTTSYLCCWILYACIFVFLSQADADDRQDACQRADRTEELDAQLSCDGDPGRVDVILDHDLHAELGMPEGRGDERRQPNGRER